MDRPLKYRLYVDEVGNSDLGSSRDPNHRYLSLTGVILELGYVDTFVAPQIEALKRSYFVTHVDDPLILHRKELVNKKPPFDALRDPEVESCFNAELLQLLRELEYAVITVVIDKLEHMQRYEVWRHDPYHYSQQVLLERYVHWLNRQDAQGDVLAESRGGKEDKRLKDSFERIYERGTDFVKAEVFSRCLTSKQLKVKLKANNICGLQLADLMAHPSYKAVLARQQRQALPPNFGGQIAQILEDQKYVRSPDGKIDGWGRKWLP
ncbi:MAG: DUF3800 domain-containing protein [Chloroflexi bacterium]|nr:DUF3800 domain-containing protein [Chloroflexota bacterium]